MADGFYETFTFIGSPALVGAIVGGVWAMGTDSPFIEFALRGAAVGAIGAVVVLIMSNVFKAAQQGAERRRAESAQLAEAARQRAYHRNSLQIDLVRNASDAVEAFEKLPGLVGSADVDTHRAREFFQDGAFSPFWSAIESAYRNLGDYAQSALRIEACAKKHPGLVGELVLAGGAPGGLADFPVRLDSSRASEVLTEATDQLGKMVYEAQKIPVFAQIWEQRRTTAAVVVGFANLEQAVARMASSVSSAISGMEQALVASGRETHSQLQGVLVGATAASQQQVEAMSALNGRADSIRQEVHRISWGSYPIL